MRVYTITRWCEHQFRDALGIFTTLQIAQVEPSVSESLDLREIHETEFRFHLRKQKNKDQYDEHDLRLNVQDFTR